MSETALKTIESRAPLATTPMEMLERAVSTGADVAVMERLMELHDRWQSNQARVAFSSALAALRGDLPAITKSREVDFRTPKGRTHYRYEALSDIIEAVSAPMAKHGLSFRWRTDSATVGTITVTCILEHEAGHLEETTLSGPYDTSGNKNAIQAVGSVTTYLQRYTLKAALGISASEDDDGRQGARNNEPPQGQDAQASKPVEQPEPKQMPSEIDEGALCMQFSRQLKEAEKAALRAAGFVWHLEKHRYEALPEQRAVDFATEVIQSYPDAVKWHRNVFEDEPEEPADELPAGAIDAAGDDELFGPRQ